MNPTASCGVVYPPLRGIVQLTNSDVLRFQNWSFTIKVREANTFNRKKQVPDKIIT